MMWSQFKLVDHCCRQAEDRSEHLITDQASHQLQVTLRYKPKWIGDHPLTTTNNYNCAVVVFAASQWEGVKGPFFVFASLQNGGHHPHNIMPSSPSRPLSTNTSSTTSNHCQLLAKVNHLFYQCWFPSLLIANRSWPLNITTHHNSWLDTTFNHETQQHPQKLGCS